MKKKSLQMFVNTHSVEPFDYFLISPKIFFFFYFQPLYNEILNYFEKSKKKIKLLQVRIMYINI